MKELIDKIVVKESEVTPIVKWLADSPNHGLESHDLTCIVKHLLKQVEIQKLRIDLLVQENYLKNQKQ